MHKKLFLLFAVAVVSFLLGYNMRQPEIIFYQADSAGSAMVGKVTSKEEASGKYFITAGAYGKFLVTKEQYEAIKVGDPIPEYLKKRGS